MVNASQIIPGYQLILETMSEGAVTLKADGTILYANRRFAEMVGCGLKRVTGSRLRTFVPPGALDDFDRIVQQACTGSASGRIDLLRPDGSLIPASMAVHRLDGGGTPGIVAVITDLSELQRTDSECGLHACIVENAQDAIISAGFDGIVTFWNKGAEKIYGYAAAEMVGRNIDILIPQEQKGEIAGLIARMQRGEEIEHYETQRMTKTGRRMDVDITLSPLRDSAGNLAGVYTVAREITEQKRMERSLALQTAILTTVHEVGPDGILVVDEHDRIISFNQRFVELWKMPPALAEARDDRPVLDHVAHQCADPEAFVERVRYIYAHHEERGFEQLALKDGRCFERYTVPMLLKEGAFVGRVWFFRDVTERVKAEETQRKSAPEIEYLYNNAPCGYQSVDENGVIIQINDTELALLGYRRDEVVGKMRTFDLCAPASRDLYKEAAVVLRAQGSTMKDIELELIRKDGSVLPVMVSAAAVRDEAGKFLRSLTTVYDMTERKRAETDLKEQEAIFRGLVEQEVVGAYIAAADGTCAYINPYFAKMLGYAPAEIIGRRLLDFATDTSKELLQRELLAEFSGELPASGFDVSLVRKDGSNITVLAHSALASFRGKPALIGVALDVTERKQAEIALRRLNRTLTTLSGGNEVLVRATDEAQLLHEMCRIIVERGGYLTAWIGIPRDDAAKTVTPVARAGVDGEYLQSARITWGDDGHGNGATGRAIKTGKTQVNTSFATDESMAPWRSAALEFGFVSSVALPLKDESGVFAVLTIDAAEADAFGSEELALLEELARDLAYGIKALRDRTDRKAAEWRWQDGLEAIVAAIASTVEIRDIYTAGHQQRVAELAAAMAREMRLPEDQIHGLHLAGTIHDVGKISVPFEILNKPSKLSKAEFEIVQGHVQSGYDIIKGIKFPWPIAQIVLQHHERLDGSGYPNGAKGDEMLIESKILAIADVVDAMTSHRPYRPALGPEAALAEIQKGRGKIYDAAAVDACVHVMAQKTRPPA